ncbi:MAG: M20/M25/M40 family metallo-hydrolase, partial [Arthrobacter sp.]
MSDGSLVAENRLDAADQVAAELFAQLNRALDRELPAAVDFRHELHAFPCLSGQEQPAADKLEDFIGLPAVKAASTGFYVRTGPAEGPSVAVRTELDGLPLTEENNVPFASVNGAMHACGHDVHQAAFAAFVRAATRVELPVAVTAIAQPREETYPSGALDVINDGILTREDVAAALAVHVHPGIPEGAVAT